MQIELLRRATAEDHDAVEGAMPLLGEGLSAAGYRQTLERIYGLVCPWEELLLAEIAAPLRPLAEARRRRDQLASDISKLGGQPSSLPVAPMPIFSTAPELLGAMYVMEGSRLGGQLIARDVTQRLGAAAGESVTYFSGFKTQTGPMWREFVQVLTEAVPDAETECAIRGAKQMFRCFGEWIAGRPVPAHDAGEHRMTS